MGDCISHSGIAYILYRRGDVSNLTRAQHLCLFKSEGRHISHVDHVKGRSRVHQLYLIARLKRSVDYSHVYHDSQIAVVIGVEYQRLKGRVCVTLGGRNVINDRLKHLLDVQSRLCGNRGTILCGNAYNVLYLGSHLVGVCRGEIYLVYNRHYLKVRIDRKIRVGKSLRLNALSCVHHEQSSVAGVERARHLVVEVNVTWGIYKVKDVILAVRRLIVKTYRARLYRYSSLLLQIHVVEHLLLHLTLGYSLSSLKYSVCQSGLAVVDMSNY